MAPSDHHGSSEASFLRRNVLAVLSGGSLRLRQGDVVVTVPLSDASFYLTASWDLSKLLGPRWAEARAELENLDFLQAEPDTQHACSLISTVGCVVTQPGSHLPRVIATSDEALLIGDRIGDAMARRALRFFISRMDWFRLQAYSALLNRQFAPIEMWGDQPSALAVAQLQSRAANMRVDEVQCLRLDNEVWTSTAQGMPGEVPSAADIDEIGDRLSSVQLPSAATRTLVEADGRRIWISSGQFALPNLDFAGAPGPRSRVPRWCIGTDGNRDLSRRKAVAEGIERFALGDVRRDELHRSPAATLTDHPWLNPTSIASYDTSQRKRLGLQEFDPSRAEWWVRGSGPEGATWLPAALVFCPFGGNARWLAPGQVSSNGAAAHTSVDEARLRSFLEVVERDAFLRTYLQNKPPQRVPDRFLQASAEALHEVIERDSDLYGAFWMESSVGLLAVGVAAWQSGRLCLGASADPDPAAACRKGVLEVLVQMRHPYGEPISDPKSVRTPQDHGRLYSGHEPSDRVRWLLAGMIRSPRDLAPLRVEDVADGAYYYQKSLGDWHVVRCLDPRQLHLSFGYDNEPRAHPVAAKLLEEVDREFPLYPHPFA